MIKRYVALILFFACAGLQNFSGAMSRILTPRSPDSTACEKQCCTADQLVDILFCSDRCITAADLNAYSQTQLNKLIVNLNSALSKTIQCCEATRLFIPMGNTVLETATALLKCKTAPHRDNSESLDFDDDADLTEKFAPLVLGHSKKGPRKVLAEAMFGGLTAVAPCLEAKRGHRSAPTPKNLHAHKQPKNQFRKPKLQARR